MWALEGFNEECAKKIKVKHIQEQLKGPKFINFITHNDSVADTAV